MTRDFSQEKSQYSHCLSNFINLKLAHNQRYENYRTMQEIEELLIQQGDEIAIIISTKNTYPDSITPMENNLT